MEKKYLRTLLNMGMHEMQQMLAFYFNTIFATTDMIYLPRYKILINDPLHDILNHINNIREKPSHHIPQENKIYVKKYYFYIQWKTDTKFNRSQKSLLIFTLWLIKNLKIHFNTYVLI